MQKCVATDYISESANKTDELKGNSMTNVPEKCKRIAVVGECL